MSRDGRSAHREPGSDLRDRGLAPPQQVENGPPGRIGHGVERIGAGTHDIGITFSRKARTFSHSVDDEIDEERRKIENDLIFTGDVTAAGLIGRPSAPRSFQNATGDQLQTDGAICVLRLK